MHLADRLHLQTPYTARPYAGASDHAAMAPILTAARKAKGQPAMVTAEQLDQVYADLRDCDPDLDIAMIERDGELVGYCRPVFSQLEQTLDLVVFAPMLPDHANPQLFDTLVQAQETHLRKWIDPQGTPARLRAYAGHPGPGVAPTGEAAWLEGLGYVATEWEATLVRPHLDDIPKRQLPDGIEKRPVDPDTMIPILEAHHEAFRGEWDFAELQDDSFDFILDDPNCDPSLWQVAWHGDVVVGQVKPFINHAENEERGYLRGYTEFISTHADYRNRGIAGTLLADALRAIKDRGMTEAALGVDTNNPGGAFQLYTNLGFELRSYEAIYTKPCD